MASLAYVYKEPRLRNAGGQHLCGTRAQPQRSRMWSRYLDSTFANGRRFGHNAAAIPGTETSGPSCQRSNSAGHPHFVLGGSAPRLQRLLLDGFSFPGLPNLRLSTTHLIYLNLSRIPDSGCFSPEAIATCLSVMTRLENLTIKFESLQPRSDDTSRRLPPQTRTLPPVLTMLCLTGDAGTVNIWRTSWPGSMPLYSTTWR